MQSKYLFDNLNNKKAYTVIKLIQFKVKRQTYKRTQEKNIKFKKNLWALLTRSQSNLTKSASRGARPIPRLGVTPKGRNL